MAMEWFVLDKVLMRNHFGESGDADWVDADVNCDGVVQAGRASKSPTRTTAKRGCVSDN